MTFLNVYLAAGLRITNSSFEDIEQFMTGMHVFLFRIFPRDEFCRDMLLTVEIDIYFWPSVGNNSCCLDLLCI